jgi:hypothetical protein
MFEVQYVTRIAFDYINWKGSQSRRRARVMGIFWGSTEYHPEEQWLIKAMDLDKKQERVFAMRDMSNVIKINEWF